MKNKMKITAILLLAITGGIISSCGQILSKPQRPNILYIFTDDQSIRTLSCYPQAQPWAHTPNIDKLAEQGVKFSYSYTGAKCVPSRGNALTGKLQFGYTKETQYWPVNFREQGYYTGMIGKWHWDFPRHEETWDWSAALGEALQQAATSGAIDDQETYYHCVLSALEGLVARNSVIDQPAMAGKRKDWKEAYLSTPHGQPVNLKSNT